MKNDNLKAYIELRAALVTEKKELEARLSEIEAALGGDVSSVPAAAPKASSVTKGKRGRPRKVVGAAVAKPKAAKKSNRGRKPAGGVSLKDAVIAVLNGGATHKDSILKAVGPQGYKFTTKDPKNYLNVVLYTNKKLFKNEGKGVFSLIGASAPKKAAKATKTAKPAAKRRGRPKSKAKKK